MTGPSVDSPLWTPSPERVARSNLRAFADHVGLGRTSDGGGVDYDALWRWSVEHPERFWPAVWRFAEVIADTRGDGTQWDDVVVGLDRMAPPDPVLGPRWFTGARLSFAEHLLRHAREGGDRTALVARNERGTRRTLSWNELRQSVAAMRAALAAEGVKAGDRVAGFLPNIPEAVIAMLAASSLGAVWSSCSPDFGVKGVLDRFSQIEPAVLVCADGYVYSGKEIDSLGRVRDIADAIPSVRRVVVVPYLRGTPDVSGVRDAVTWDDFVADRDDAEPSFARLPFDHPLYILYSSGTTGLPKCMVHSAGGTLLQHLKEHLLHVDLHADDVMFYFTTCGWMMWNWLVSALAVGATVVLYDGAPMAPANDALWTMAQEERVTVFGTSAKYLALCEKEALSPIDTKDLSALRAILSTGSPLAPASFDWVYARDTRGVKRDVLLASMSGGTDIVSCFCAGVPTAPVWRGEIQARALGMAVAVFDERGRAVVEQQGELVCTRPFPSMPVAFWNDPTGAKYRAAYFDAYPGVWRHGDWCELTAHGGLVITGRSDATLNPGGVRVGTAEIYRQVELLPEIVESLVVGQDVGDDVRIVLFVRLREGVALDDALRARVRAQIREGTSPHHVPRVIVQVSDIPRTISGKITELAVRDVIHGRPVNNTDALANPEALQLYRDLPELRASSRA